MHSGWTMQKQVGILCYCTWLEVSDMVMFMDVSTWLGMSAMPECNAFSYGSIMVYALAAESA